MGTQRADLGEYKVFTLNLVTMAVPNLIAFDLVMVQPMSSFTGNVAYAEYVAGSTKGETAQGDFYNSAFKLGKVDPNYTAEKVSGEAKPVATATAVEGQLRWFPIVPGSVNIVHGSVSIADDGAGKLTATTGLTGDCTIDYETGKYTYTLTTEDTASVPFANYVYDNVVVPQNDVPLLSVRMNRISLEARARRIGIMFSQMAAFQAKQDYGFDMQEQLAMQAVGRLSYEIDTEVIQLLADNAPQNEDLVWSKSLPTGVNKRDHYEGFMEIVEDAKAIIYNRTQKFAPNYMVIASNIVPILSFISSFTRAPAKETNGPYYAGTLGTLKLYVSPAMEPGSFFLGVNGQELNTSAAVYAPYQQLHTIKNNLISVAA